MYAFSQRLACALHLLNPSCSHATSLRRFASKGKNISDIIRWNSENKMLFGSLQKDVAKKKPSTNSSETTKQKDASKKKSTKNTSDSAKTAQKKKTAAKKKHPVDDVTKQRLQDMYMYSVQSSAPGDQVDDLEGNFVATKNMKSEGEPDFLHDVPEDVLVPDNQAEVTVDDSESLEYFPEERTNDVHIPKVLPVPGSTNTASVTSTVSTKKKHSISEASGAGETSRNAVVGQSKSPALENQDSTPPIAAPKEMDFILQCPVLPPDGSEATQGVQELRGVIEKLGMRLMPTVNVVLNKTRSDLGRFFLQRWRQGMIQELGEEGFKKHQEKVIWEGTNFHACVQQFLSGMPVNEIQIQESNKGHWESLQSVLPDVKDVLALETPVSHPWLFYRGTFDCVAKYKDVLYVIDWKTSSKPKPLLSNLYDNPLQVAAYLGAINLRAEFTSKFGVVDHAAIVVAYQNGQPAHIHRMKPAMCQHYWTQWCQRLHQYWAMVAAEKGITATPP